MEMFLVGVLGYIRKEVMNEVQKLLYNEKALGRFSDNPTVVNHSDREGVHRIYVTNKELPAGVNPNDFLLKITISGEETPDNPYVHEFELGGESFKVTVIGQVIGYDYDGYNKYDSVQIKSLN